MFYIKRLIVLPIITLLVSAIVITDSFSSPLAIPKSKPAAPEFVLQDMTGKQYALSDYRGRVVVLNFWASWCPPCVEEMPSMQRAADKLAEHDIPILGIGAGETRESVTRFLESTPVGFPLLLDSNLKVMETWSIPSLPVTLVIDPQGRIALVALGGREWDSPEILEQIIALKQAQ